MTLSDMAPGDKSVVLDITARGAFGQRLMDLGFYPSAKIRVVRNAPLGDPVEIELEGYHISLRHEEAALVRVEKK